MEKEVILKPKEDNMTTFSIRVDKELSKKYDDLSNKSGYSRNELVNFAMQHYIEVVKFVPDTPPTEVEKSTTQLPKKPKKIPIKDIKK